VGTARGKQELTVTGNEDDAGVHLIVKGELDVASAPVLLEWFRNVVAHGFGDVVWLDMTGLRFVDSVGLWLLITMEKRARANKTRFILSPPNEPFARLLDATCLREFFDFDSVQKGHGAAEEFLSRVRRSAEVARSPGGGGH
jgi:anti-anti-sigma factor